ncbi:hypothetical protein FD755_011227, partial [Muntiacus reevesi]
SAVPKPLRPGSSPDSKVTLVLPVSAGTEDQRWPQALPICRSAGPGTRTSLLYGKGARVCGNVTPASFGGKSPAFGFLWWRAKDGLPRDLVESWQCPLWKTGTWCKPWEKVPMEIIFSIFKIFYLKNDGLSLNLL